MTSREKKALRLYNSRKIKRLGPNTFTVARRKRKGAVEQDPWLVRFVDGMWTCNCPPFANAYKCKHADAVVKWNEKGEPTVYYPDQAFPRPTYPQDWPKYRAARKAATIAMLPLLAALLRYSVTKGVAA